MTWLFYIGLAIDTSLLLIMCLSTVTMPGALGGGTYPEDPLAGLTAFGWAALWLFPVALLALMASAWMLKARGATGTAVILLWLPALPFALAMTVGIGLAVLFMLYGNR